MIVQPQRVQHGMSANMKRGEFGRIQHEKYNNSAA